jgi:hypothetical protein
MRASFVAFHSLYLLVAAALLSGVAGALSPASAQSTAFTYQGSLDDGGAPASGLHDFRFRLFSVASGGTPIGSTLCVDNVSVVEGVFTVQLDFGQQYATTAQRHLEIEVRRDTGLTCANVAGFVLMAPRQQITATPMASHATSAFALDAADGSPTNAVYVDDDGRVGIGTTSPVGSLHVNGSIFWGGGASDHAYSGLDASGMFIEQNGSVSANSKIRLQTSKSGDATNYSQLFIDPNAGFAFNTLGTGNGNVGIGTLTPTAKLDVRGDVRLGPTGQLLATSGEENLRIVRGSLSPDGSILSGAGFTVAHPFIGVYDITFNPSFATPPTVTAVPRLGDFSRTPIMVVLGDVTASGVRFAIDNNDSDEENFNFTDRQFHFIAIGLR